MSYTKSATDSLYITYYANTTFQMALSQNICAALKDRTTQKQWFCMQFHNTFSFTLPYLSNSINLADFDSRLRIEMCLEEVMHDSQQLQRQAMLLSPTQGYFLFYSPSCIFPFPWIVVIFKVAAKVHLFLNQRVVIVGSCMWYW